MNEHNNPAPSDPPEKQLPRLYSLNSIGFSTFFGSMLAGFFLLAANYHALGMKRPATWAIAAGLIAFCVYSFSRDGVVRARQPESGSEPDRCCSN